jgi:hypothetical protein
MTIRLLLADDQALIRVDQTYAARGPGDRPGSWTLQGAAVDRRRCPGSTRPYQVAPDGALVVALSRLKKFVVAMVRMRAASPRSS